VTKDKGRHRRASKSCFQSSTWGVPPATSRRRTTRKDAGGLSATTVGRLKDAWSQEHARWSKRNLSAKRYLYFWTNGIHVQARLEDAAQCLLVIIGRRRRVRRSSLV
jgi:hypothetical protein